MTFIASVVAKKGVAIIADSLVTSTLPILHYRRFLDHLKEQPKNESGEILVKPEEIQKLFKVEPVYTKDFEEKLFKLNLYTAITTTGIAEINDKKIIDIVNEFIAHNQNTINDFQIPIETRINQFKDFVTEDIKAHILNNGFIGTCIFIVTFYEKSTSKTHIYRMTTKEADVTVLENNEFQYVNIDKEADWIKVVCDGQNKLSDNVLYGSGKTIYERFRPIVTKTLEKLNLPEGTVPQDFIEKLREDNFFQEIFYADLELLNLRDLSLQQAVDLASLLMRLEVDFQKYTKNVPTVGGVIKLATIDDSGFEPRAGYDIIPPKHIML